MRRPATRTRAAVAATTASSPISKFTRVSKGAVSLDGSAKKAVIDPPTTTRKRKAAEVEEDTHSRLTSRTVSFPPSSDDESLPVKRTRRQEPQATITKTARVVTKGKKVAKAEPKRTATAHKPSETTIIAKSRQQSKKVQTKLDTAFKRPEKPRQETINLPPHLADLLDLTKAFIKTILIHIAHNGRAAPIDIQTIIPDISRSWGKRTIAVTDMQRCIALLASPDSPTPFQLTDYGRGKVFVSLVASGQAPLDPEALQKNALQALQRTPQSATALCSDQLETLSLSDVPQAQIAKVESRGPLLTQGQARLRDFMANPPLPARSNAASARPGTVRAPALAAQSGAPARLAAQNTAEGTTQVPAAPKVSLLDRIRLKQLAKRNEALPPSGPELERRAALNRVADVVAIISMLTLSNPISLPRQAFTMAIISEKLKDSLRMPMSKEEGVACVRLIASEVAPEWLRIVTIGGRENVVVQRSGQPVDRVIHQRVQNLLA